MLFTRRPPFSFSLSRCARCALFINRAPFPLRSKARHYVYAKRLVLIWRLGKGDTVVSGAVPIRTCFGEPSTVPVERLASSSAGANGSKREPDHQRVTREALRYPGTPLSCRAVSLIPSVLIIICRRSRTVRVGFRVEENGTRRRVHRVVVEHDGHVDRLRPVKRLALPDARRRQGLLASRAGLVSGHFSSDSDGSLWQFRHAATFRRIALFRRAFTRAASRVVALFSLVIAEPAAGSRRRRVKRAGVPWVLSKTRPETREACLLIITANSTAAAAIIRTDGLLYEALSPRALTT